MTQIKSSCDFDYSRCVNQMIAEAKSHATLEFKEFKMRLTLESDFTTMSCLQFLKVELDKAKNQYNLDLDVRNQRAIKAKIVDLLIKSKILPVNGELDPIGYSAYESSLSSQYLVLKKIEFLQKKLLKVEENNLEQEFTGIQKIQWLGQPSQLAHLIVSLIEKGYIGGGKKSANSHNLRTIAQIIYRSFSIPSKSGIGDTTFENFYKEMRNNSLTIGGVQWISIKKKL